MFSHRLRQVLVALPCYFQRPLTPTRSSKFPTVSSLFPRTVVKQSRGFGQSPARFFSTTQYQYDPYTGEDSFTPDNEGCDFKHWLITMEFPKENPPSREEMISIFEQTCAKGLALSLEEAKRRMYAICTTSYQGFQATMSIGQVENFRDLPGVQYIIPDSYVDVENKVYGGDKYENGVISPGPIPVPTKEGFDALEKESTSEQEQAQTHTDQDLNSEQMQGQESQTLPDQMSFKQDQGTLSPRQGRGRGQGPTLRQGLGQGTQMPSYRGSFIRDQGTPTLGKRQVQGNQIPSFQGSFKQSQGSPSVGHMQGQESQMASFQRGYNQGQGALIQGQAQGSYIPSYQMGYNQVQGAQTPPCQGSPSSYGQGAVTNKNQGSLQGNFIQGMQENYNQGQPQGSFIQGTQENYNQMGKENNTPQSSGNYGPPQEAGSPGFGHGKGPGGQLLSPYQKNYNQGQGTPMPGQDQGGQIPSYQMGYSQDHGAPVPPYQVNYNQGIPGSYGQWAFVNYNQGLPHGNFLQGPHQNYNPGGQWNFSPPNGGSPPQFGNQMPQYQVGYNHGQGAPFPGQWQCQGCGMISYQGSYNQGQGTPNPGQWQGQGCAMPSSYQSSYSHSQGASVPPHQGNYYNGIPRNYGQGTSANFNQGIPENYNQTRQGNCNLQSGGSYVHTHGSAGFPGQGQNQTSPQEDQRNVAGGWSNNNIPTNPTETGKIPH